MSNEQTTDTTNGEAIYSSDGLSPIPIPPPPPTSNSRRRTVNTNTNNDDDDNDGIDYESKDAIEAFEVFSGRVFYPSSLKNNESVSYSGGGSTRSSSRQYHETKLQKLARIQSELKELENDFSLGSVITNSNEEDEQQRLMEHNEIMTIVKDLTNKLQSLQNGLDISKRQYELTTFVNSLSINDKTNEVNDGGSKNINNEQSSNNTLTQEQRLLRIEQFIGSHGNIVGSSISDNLSIMERLKQAEAKLRSVDETTLTQASNRAKVIR